MKYDSKYLCDTLGIDPGGVESIEEAQTDSGPVCTSQEKVDNALSIF